MLQLLLTHGTNVEIFRAVDTTMKTIHTEIETTKKRLGYTRIAQVPTLHKKHLEDGGAFGVEKVLVEHL